MIKSLEKYFIAFVLAFFVMHSAQARSFEEGKDYEIRNQVKTKQPEIREVFSFFCSHCYAMNDKVIELNSRFKDKAPFYQNPTGLIGGQMGVESQYAFAIATHMGILEYLEPELFKIIHEENIMPDSHQFYAEVFARLGVPNDKFEQEYSSFIIQGMVAQYDRFEQDLKIDAVPEVIVNGKYVVNLDLLDNEKEYLELIDYLLALD